MKFSGMKHLSGAKCPGVTGVPPARLCDLSDLALVSLYRVKSKL